MTFASWALIKLLNKPMLVLSYLFRRVKYYLCQSNKISELALIICVYFFYWELINTLSDFFKKMFILLIYILYNFCKYERLLIALYCFYLFFNLFNCWTCAFSFELRESSQSIHLRLLLLWLCLLSLCDIGFRWWLRYLFRDIGFLSFKNPNSFDSIKVTVGLTVGQYYFRSCLLFACESFKYWAKKALFFFLWLFLLLYRIFSYYFGLSFGGLRVNIWSRSTWS
jgi:hypothetical protein